MAGVVTAALVMTGVNACASSESQPNASSTAEKVVPEKINIGYIPNQNAPFFVAKSQKIFEEHGLIPNFVKFTTGPPQFAALGSGDIDVTDIGTLPFLIGLSNGLDIQYVMSAFEANTTNAIVGNDSIKSVADLKGKNVALAVGSSSSLMLGKALQNTGLSEADVNIVNTQPGNMVPSFVHGDVDAVVSWWPWSDQVVLQGGHVITTMKEEGGAVPDVWAARAEFAEKRPEVLKRFVAAINDATEKHTADPEKVIPVMATELGIDADLVKKAVSLPIYADAKKQMSSGYNLSMAGNDITKGLAAVMNTDAEFLLLIKKITRVPDVLAAQNNSVLTALVK